MESGRTVAAEDMLRTRASRLRAYLCMLLGNDADVEDVLQDVWVKFLEEGPAEEDHAWRWLLRVSRNAALDFHRGSKHRREREHVFGHRAVSTTIDPAAEAETRAARERIGGCLNKLPEGMRELVYLKFGEDLSLSEIAEHTGVPRSTVALRVQEGLVLLNRCFHGDPRAPGA